VAGLNRPHAEELDVRPLYIVAIPRPRQHIDNPISNAISHPERGGRVLYEASTADQADILRAEA
jgi:signal transduction histidine kinase